MGINIFNLGVLGGLGGYGILRILQGILPICSFCKQIRDDQGYWDKVEVYIGRHSNAQFSHSICPDCMKEHYSEYCGGEEDCKDDGEKGEAT